MHEFALNIWHVRIISHLGDASRAFCKVKKALRDHSLYIILAHGNISYFFIFLTKRKCMLFISVWHVLIKLWNVLSDKKVFRLWCNKRISIYSLSYFSLSIISTHTFILLSSSLLNKGKREEIISYMESIYVYMYDCLSVTAHQCV